MIATMPITAVTLRGLLGRRRTLLMLLLVGLPVLVALLARIAEGSLEVDRILDPLGVRTILPLVALVFGTAALGSELEDGTAVFLIIKPIPRWRIVGAKMLVAAGLTIALIMPATVATGIVAGGFGPWFAQHHVRLCAGRLAGRRGLRERVRRPERVHRTGADHRARVHPDLGGDPRRASSRGPASCRSARPRWGSRPG